MWQLFKRLGLRAIVSKQVGPTEQGKAQGCITGLNSLAGIISPLVFSPLTALFLSDHAPFHFPGFSVMCAALSVMIAFIQSIMMKAGPAPSHLPVSDSKVDEFDSVEPSVYLNMRRKHENEFTNGGFNEFQKQTGNILNRVETFVTFGALDNVLSGYGLGCDVPSVGAPLASCYSRITGLYLDVFRKCSEFCGVKSQRECSTTFRVINRTEDTQLYLDVYRKYSRVSGKVPCVQQGTGSSAFVGSVGDGLDKHKLQPSGHSDVFKAYLALCSSGAGSRRSRSLSQITPVFNSNLVHTDCDQLSMWPSASLPGRSFHANTNDVIITADSQNSYPVSREGGNTRENCQLMSTIGVSNNGSSASHRARNVQVRPRVNSVVGVRSTSRRTGRRVLTSDSTADTNSVASAGTSYTYSDLGDCDQRCRYCGASFWYVERLKGHSHNQTPEYHLCCGGSLCPPAEELPRFLQLYIYDTDNEVQNRMHHFKGIDNSQLERGIVEGARGYELPTSNTLGGMVFENGISDNADFDVIIQHRDGPPQRVNKLHPSYMSLQFLLLFIYGQPGYHTELMLKSANGV
nr:helitron helicase-like domain-containing protein [Tanacetum cinerariifolium]